MTVKELIKELELVKNKNSRVDIIIPYEWENDTSRDFESRKFSVDDSHGTFEDEPPYVELYSHKTQYGKYNEPS